MGERKEISIRITYHLNQQTPMIHFQYDQAGAGIRASELKPKLDQFLKDKYGDELRKEWFIPGTAALNYKVRVFTSGESKISKTVERDLRIKKDRKNKKEILKQYEDHGIQGMYFGNMANTMEDIIDSYKESVFYDNGCTLEIICLYQDLREKLNHCLAEFFAVTNFGTRQNKGFGGFSIASGEQTLELLRSNNYLFFYTRCKKGMDEYNAKLNIADAIYSAMKGGKNFTFRNDEAYVKGYIQRDYLNENRKSKTGSDKAFMKSKSAGFFPNQADSDKYDEYKYVRAILGLADHIEFRDERKGIITIKCDDDKIQRYKSPVTIKIVDEYIFFIWNDTFDQIKGKTFTFVGKEDNSLDSKGNPVSNVHPESKKISVPDSFNARVFIGGFIRHFESEKSGFAAIGKPFRDAANVKLYNGNNPANKRGGTH